MDVTTIKGIGRQYGKKLNKAGATDVADLRNMDIEGMSQKTGISAERLEDWQQRARDMKLLTDVPGIGPTYSQRLHKQGITTPEELAAADICATAKDIDVSKKRLTKWVEIAQKMVETTQPKAKKAVVAEPIGSDNASILIKGDEAIVTIKGTVHDCVPVFHGDGMETIAQDQKIAVHVDSTGTTHLWFNEVWYTNVPVKKEGFLDKIKRMLGI
jgi:predicted flap endonuclease-1-like 5' DNA nuclease